jgi:hypothetical protein
MSTKKSVYYALKQQYLISKLKTKEIQRRNQRLLEYIPRLLRRTYSRLFKKKRQSFIFEHQRNSKEKSKKVKKLI